VHCNNPPEGGPNVCLISWRREESASAHVRVCRVGSRLGPYGILAPLGSGGMGAVYRATDTRLKRQVAVKILLPALAADPDRLVRFQREAKVLAYHPHIAAVYGLEDAAGLKALVLELVEGLTLADRIAQGPIPIGVRLDDFCVLLATCPGSL
jgi:serine/threonine protein kinase